MAFITKNEEEFKQCQEFYEDVIPLFVNVKTNHETIYGISCPQINDVQEMIINALKEVTMPFGSYVRVELGLLSDSSKFVTEIKINYDQWIQARNYNIEIELEIAHALSNEFFKGLCNRYLKFTNKPS